MKQVVQGDMRRKPQWINLQVLSGAKESPPRAPEQPWINRLQQAPCTGGGYLITPS